MKISLIITTFNRPDALSLVLESVINQSILPDEIIIADDGSTNETKTMLENFEKHHNTKLTHIYQPDRGFRVGRIRNKAIAASNGDYIVLIDGDMILDKHFIKDHKNNSELGFFIQGSRAFINEKMTAKSIKERRIIFRFYAQGITNRFNAIRSKILSNFFIKKSTEQKGIKTCNMSFYKKDFIAVNGFNHEIFGWGREDSELVARFYNYGLFRKSIKFLAIQFHLWHRKSDISLINDNDEILRKTIDSKSFCCKSGIDEFF